MTRNRIILPTITALLALPVIALSATSPDKASMPQLPAYAVPPTATLRLVLSSTPHAINSSTSVYSIGPSGAITTGTIKPGDVVVFAAGNHPGPQIVGFTSTTAAAPIMFTNDGSLLRASAQWRNARAALGREPGPAGWPAAGGKVTFSGSSVKGDKMVNIQNSRHIHFDGRGDANTEYGFDVMGGGRFGGYYAEQQVTNIWFWHCATEGTAEGFTIKTDPTATVNRDVPNAFIQRDTQVIHCWIRNTTGREGMYLGYTSFYRYTASGSSGYKPIEVIGMTVRDCLVENTGFDGIQTTGAAVEVSWNTVRNCATLAAAGQEASIIANPSRGPQNIHNNTIIGTRRGIEFQANSGAIHHNTFVGCVAGYMLFVKLPVPADGYGQYLADSEIAGKHLSVENNTGQGGTSSPVWIIRDRGTCELKNNIFVPSVPTCYVLSTGAKAVTTRHVAPDPEADYITTSTAAPQFVAWASDLRLNSSSPAIGKGAHPVAGAWWDGGVVVKPIVSTTDPTLAEPTPAGPTLAGLTLINADSEREIGPFTDGYAIAFSAIGTQNLNVRANPGSGVGSVRFGLDGNPNYRTETTAPLALGGDTGGNFDAWIPSIGSHTLTVTPYSGSNATGTAGAPTVVRFTVTGTTATYTATVTVVGDGAVTKSPAKATYAQGETVSLTAVPATGWRFTGWSGAAFGSANPISIAMNANKSVTATFTQITAGPAVTSMVLINADTDREIGTIADGDTIDFAKIGTRNLNIVAKTSGTVANVQFGLDTNPNYKIESTAPFALAGDSNGNFNAWTPSLGTHYAWATAYSGKIGTETLGTTLTLRFVVVGSVAKISAANSPNPFNPSTVIRFATPVADHVSLAIYSANGQLVRQLVDATLEAGLHEIAWDATDAGGRKVASGIYLYVIRSGGEMLVQRMVFAR